VNHWFSDTIAFMSEEEETIPESYSYPTTPMEKETKKERRVIKDEDIKNVVEDNEIRIRQLEERLSSLNLAKLEKRKKKTKFLLNATLDTEGTMQDRTAPMNFDPNVKNKWDSVQREIIEDLAAKKKVFWVKHELEFIDDILGATTAHEILSAVEERIQNLALGLKFGWDTGAEKKERFMDAFGVEAEQFETLKKERKEKRGEFLAMKMGKKNYSGSFSSGQKNVQTETTEVSKAKPRGPDGLTDAQRRARTSAKCFACGTVGHFKGDKGFPCSTK